MGQAGYQGSKGDEEYGRKEHVGAAERTGACLGGGQPVPSRDQGTVLVDLLETFGKNKRKSPKAKSRVFSDAPDHTTFCRRLTRASAPILRHGRGILQWDVLPSPFPQADSQGITAIVYIAPSQDFSSSAYSVKKALPRSCICHVPTASLQPPPSPASKVHSALQTTCFTHHLFGSGRISGAVCAASEAGGDVLHVVFSAHRVKDVLRAVAPTRRLNLLLGTQCTAKKEEKKNFKKLRSRTGGRKIPLTS